MLLVVAVVVTGPPFLPLGATTVSFAQLAIQLSVVGASGAGEKDMRFVGGKAAGGCCSSLCSCSRHSANLVWPRERAMDRGKRPRESGIARARLSHLYRTTAASRWPSAHAHICKNGN